MISCSGKTAIFTLAALMVLSSGAQAQTKSPSPLQAGMTAATTSANATVQQGLNQAYGGGMGMQGLPYGGYPVYNAYLPYGGQGLGNCLPGMPGCAQMPGTAPAQAAKPQYVYKDAKKKGMIDAPMPKRLFNNIPKRK